MEPWLYVASSFAGSAQIFLHLTMVINAIRGGLRRFVGYFFTYRWEFMLVLLLPILTNYVGAYFLGAFWWNDTLEDVVGWQAGFNLGTALVTLLCLSLCYLRVRRLQREFLVPLWRYSMVVQVVAIGTVLVFIVVGMFDPTVPEFSFGIFPYGIGGLAVQLLGALVGTIVVFWFARQLTRISLTHAFFLIAYDGDNSYVAQVSYLTWGYISPVLVGMWIAISTLVAGFVTIWLLGNFDRRGYSFKRKAVIAMACLGFVTAFGWVLAVRIYGFLRGSEELGTLLADGLKVLGWLGVSAVLFLAMLGVVYLIRVRSKKGQGTEGGSPLPAQAPTPIE